MTENDYPLSFEPPDDPLRDEEYPNGDSSGELGDDLDGDLDDSALTAPCPHCRRDIYEDAVRCPYCGTYVVWHHSVWLARAWWWIVLGLLGAAAVILALMGLTAQGARSGLETSRPTMVAAQIIGKPAVSCYANRPQFAFR